MKFVSLFMFSCFLLFQSYSQKDSLKPRIITSAHSSHLFDPLRNDNGCYFSYFVKNKSNKKTVEVRSDGMGNKLTITTYKKGKTRYKKQYNSKWIVSAKPPCHDIPITPLQQE